MHDDPASAVAVPADRTTGAAKGFIAPSQKVIVDSRLKVIGELCRIFPVSVAAIEDVCFDHAKEKK
jgi:hypothetical protein